ncbi:MAG: ATP-binding protein [Coriobacteriia bacterium]|nr:ATP-binding protein [Coriobacteriia bacterium]
MQRIIFASGKGGTGKTTLTALTARLLAEGGTPIALADCDVEAANLPIALGAQETSREPFAGGSKAVLDPDVCRGCGACALVCRFDALSTDENYYRTHAYVIDPWACEGCGACVPACLFDAITMVQSQAGEVISAEASIGPMVYGRLAPGEDLSGKLVTEVRRQADALAAERSLEAMWIDGPPGVGCPAIAAITGTDLVVGVTEPTVSGEHDLMRLVTLARRFKIPVAVVLNKADLSAEGARRLKEHIADEGLELIAEIPYDTAVAQIPERLARGEQFAYPETPGMNAIREVSAWLSKRSDSAG